MKMHGLQRISLMNWSVENLHSKLKECFVRIDTNNIESLQHMLVVIIKKGENVQPCFDVTRLQTLYMKAWIIKQPLEEIKIWRTMELLKYGGFPLYFNQDFRNWRHGVRLRKKKIQPSANLWLVVRLPKTSGLVTSCAMSNFSRPSVKDLASKEGVETLRLMWQKENWSWGNFGRSSIARLATKEGIVSLSEWSTNLQYAVQRSIDMKILPKTSRSKKQMRGIWIAMVTILGSVGNL